MNEDRPIALSRPWFDDSETQHLVRALGGKTAGDGPFCRRVEERLGTQLGSPRVLLTTSCTHALELALMALGVGAGHEVIVPSFTFVSTANAVLRAGARPVLVDIEERTLGLDPEQVERHLTPRTRALLPVHYAGIACDMPPLFEIARRKGLKIVEDAAQGLGATLDGQALGALGDAGCFSFHETKNVTCGEGGALAVRDPEVAQRAEIIREKGTNRSAFLRGEVDKYTWIAEGSSYVLSDLLAAVLDAQLDKQDEIARRRARIAARYRSELAAWAKAHGVRLPPVLPDRTVNDHIFYLLLPDAAAQATCLAALKARGVGATFHYVPLHSAPFGQGLGQGGGPYPVTERIASTLVRLPLHPLLDDADVSRVVGAVSASLG